MKKQNLKVFGTIATCAVATAAGWALPTFADASNNRIYLYNSSTSTNCEFYRASGTADLCDAGYGSYDAATKTLTLGSKINELDNPSVNVFMEGENVTVKANSDIKGAISTGLTAGMVFDLGEYTFTMNRDVDTTDGTFVIESGNFVGAGFNAKNITVNGGNFELKAKQFADIMFRADEKIIINDGEMNFEGSKLIKSKNIEINGGKIVGKKTDSAGGLLGSDSASGGFVLNINGGDLELNCEEGMACSAIYSIDSDSEVNINGGNLTINKGDDAIELGKGGKLRFNGGTTVINDAYKYSMIIRDAKDPENDIVFGDGMGIKENVPVYWSLNEEQSSLMNSTGIIGGVGTVTIAKGYTYTKHYGWDIGHGGEEYHGDDLPDDSGVPTVPDTGIFGMDGKTATIVGAIAALPVLATLAYGIKFIIKRNKQRVRF